MHSSTSNSDLRLPHRNWTLITVGALAMFLLFAAGLELALALRGFRPGVIDSESVWIHQRARASALGKRALILIGASRMQLDVDLSTARKMTGLEPVQLAIDGGSFIPVLKGLAEDPKITGTVLVSLQQLAMARRPQSGLAGKWARDYSHLQTHRRPLNFQRLETYLRDDWLHAHLRSYADGARPLTSLWRRVLNPHAVPQYIVTRPDRETLADFRKVPMPWFYLMRILRTLGHRVGVRMDMTAGQLLELLRAKAASVHPSSNYWYIKRIAMVNAMASKIARRGGRVIFVEMPKSGVVREIEDNRYPRRLFWDKFVSATPFPAVNSEDVPAMNSFHCPDGSHLDYRDRAAFTAALIRAVHLDRRI